MANALDRWDEEGGSPAVPWLLPYEPGDLLEVERRVLECLGAALVSEWNSLPTDAAQALRARGVGQITRCCPIEDADRPFPARS